MLARFFLFNMTYWYLLTFGRMSMWTWSTIKDSILSGTATCIAGILQQEYCGISACNKTLLKLSGCGTEVELILARSAWPNTNKHSGYHHMSPAPWALSGWQDYVVFLGSLRVGVNFRKRENQAKCKKAERWGSAKLFHTNIIDRLGGLMDKYT